MEEKFRHYLNEIFVPVTLQNKIEEIVNYHKEILVEQKLEKIFLCNASNENGTYDYTSLWLFLMMLYVKPKTL